MSGDPDDEALAWAGESDPSHVAGPAEPARLTTAGTPDVAADPDAPKPTSSVLLITYGILAGVYLIYVLGWIIAIQRSDLTYANLLFEIMYQFGEFLAIVSPILWFGAVILLTRNSKRISRLLWLLLGIVVLIPWPFLLSGA